MANNEKYTKFLELTSCQLFIVYRKDTSPLLMLPHKRDHRGLSRFLKNFKKLVGRIPEADAQKDGELTNMVMTWGDAYYVVRYLPDAISVIAAFPKDTNLGLIINRLDNICQTVSEDYTTKD